MQGLLLALALVGAACHHSGNAAKRVEGALPMLPPEVQPTLGSAVTRNPAGKENRYEVYMDISASMRPYFHDRVTGSPLRELLRKLGNISPTRLKTFAFGTPAGSGGGVGSRTPARQPPSPVALADLLRDGTYTGLFNDYKPLIEGFRPGSGVERLVISDGVLSSQASEASFLGATAGEINRWINGGGVFALFLFRASYYCDDAKGRFSYFSETLRDEHRPVYRVAFNTEKRPFTVFAFLNSEGALDILKNELLEGLGGTARWSLEIRPPSPLRPMDVQWDSHSLAEGIQKRTETLEVPGVPVSVKCCPLPPDPSGKNVTQLRFDLKLSEAARMLPGKTQRLLSGPEAFDVRAWVVDIPVGKPALPAQKVSAKIDPNNASIVQVAAPQAPKDGRLRLWGVAWTPSPALPTIEYDTDVAAWSTLRDDTADKADRTLNLQALVNEICHQRSQVNILPSAALLVTY